MNRGMFPSRLVGFLLLFFLLGPAAAQKDADLIEPYKPIPSAAVIIAGKFQGTGVVVNYSDRLLLTNFHVAQAGQAADAVLPMFADDGRVYVNRDLYLKKGQRIKGRGVASVPERDLSLVQVDSLPNAIAEVKLAAKSPQLEDRVHL